MELKKIGIETKQRYENILKGDFQNYFVNYTYYPLLDNGDNDKNNNIGYKKFNRKININNNNNGRYQSNNVTIKKMSKCFG